MSVGVLGGRRRRLRIGWRCVCWMRLALEVDVYDVRVVPHAPDLKTELGPSDVDAGPIGRAHAIGLFVEALRAVHEALDLVRVRDVSLGHVRGLLRPSQRSGWSSLRAPARSRRRRS